jgi:hypothetical protein
VSDNIRTIRGPRGRLALAATALVLTVAGGATTTPAAAGPGWVLTGDYSQFGRVRSFAAAAPWSVSGDLAVTPGDAVGRLHDGRLYVVGRGSASLLQVYATQPSLTLVREFSLGAGRNPQDIAFDTQGRAFVSCYDQALLLRVDVEAGTVTQTYSTAAFADTDGLPETSWLLARGDRLFITCQRLDRANWYLPTGPGRLLVFDMAAGQWIDADPAQPGVQGVTLPGADPCTRIEPVGLGGRERLRVGCAGEYGALDGGIADVDPQALTSPGWVVTEAQLGGDLTAFVSAGPQNVWAIVTDIVSGDTDLVRWTGGGAATMVRPGGGWVFADLAGDGGCQVFLADRTPAASGLRMFDACTGAMLTAAPLATGLPPTGFALAADPVAAPVPLPPAAATLQLGPAWPNPCNPRARFAVAGPAGAVLTVRVTDLAGRAVAEEHLRLDDQGQGEVVFAGRDHAGRALPAGVYRVTAAGATGTATRAVTLVK